MKDTLRLAGDATSCNEREAAETMKRYLAISHGVMLQAAGRMNDAADAA